MVDEWSTLVWFIFAAGGGIVIFIVIFMQIYRQPVTGSATNVTACHSLQVND